MAVFVARYRQTRAEAKKTLKYIAYRTGRDGQKISRQLFDGLGAADRRAMYERIDQARRSDYFYHLIISPSPTAEDNHRDLYLHEVAEETFGALYRQTGPVTWVAAIHDDHTDKRHIHAFAITTRKLNRGDLTATREATTAACLEQRRELDRVREQQRRRERQRDIDLELEEELPWHRD